MFTLAIKEEEAKKAKRKQMKNIKNKRGSSVGNGAQQLGQQGHNGIEAEGVHKSAT